ncbi:MAG: Serine protease, DegP/HtrA, do-like [Firmicutes bacterium]|nr:Serine protease, DegP/HtrA, do-like [Bacillota bacterium]MDI6705028.1 trypsin-like peptidase domain-containing protein [Bacillota bacterium]
MEIKASKLYPYLIVAVVASVLGGAVGGLFSGDLIAQRRPSQYRDEQGIDRIRIVYPEGENPGIVSAVAEKNIQAVVSITTVEIRRDEIFRPTEVRGVGSGVVVNPNGYILTNDHVVGRNPREVMVLFENGDQKTAEVLWQDAALDLALVKVEGANLPYVELGNSDAVKVGEPAIAIGSPLGLRFQRTVTSGIISALNRSLVVDAYGQEVIMEDLIQTDASINPGNSGGPLLDVNGRVIGINTVKASEAEAIGFAVPINIAKPIIKQIVDKGYFRPMYLGIEGYDKEIAGYYNSDVDVQKGIYVARVNPNTPADIAGIREGDIILKIGDQEVNTLVKMRSILYSMDQPQTVDLVVKRDGKVETIRVELAPRPHGY